MTDRNDKNFFDEEYEKFSKREEETSRQQIPDENRADNAVNAWANADIYVSDGGGRKKKSLYVVLLCVALLLTFILGWVVGAVVQKSSAGDDAILNEVLSYLRNSYYKDMTDAEWENAIAEGGTGLLQGAGDNYGRLLTPQQYYDLMNPVELNGDNMYFGISYQVVHSVGIYVSSVSTDGSCYGVMDAGDIIISVSDLKDKEGNAVLDADGNAVGSIDTRTAASDYVQDVINKAYTASFTFLHGSNVETATVKRGKTGIEGNRLSFVEYYFGVNNTNVSVQAVNEAKASTYELRKLSMLPADTGYIRLTEFSQYTESHSVYTEFVAAMQLFRSSGKTRLILDMKGNPGGDVSLVSEIGGVLSTTAGLSSDVISANNVLNSYGQLLMTRLKGRNYDRSVYVTSSFGEYFTYKADGPRDIVIWTDGNSASASELLTGVLKDYNTAFQIGNTTYGKGIAQSVEPLDFKGKIITNSGTEATYPWGIYYTAAHYYSPLGINIHEKGYTPDAGYSGINDYERLFEKTAEYWGL